MFLLLQNSDQRWGRVELPALGGSGLASVILTLVRDSGQASARNGL